MNARTAALSLVVLLLAAAVLEAVVRAHVVAPTVVPPPSAIAAAFGDLAANGEIVQPALLTFGQTAAATALAVAVGVPFGIFLARAPAFGAAYESWLGAAFAAPMVLLYPLFLVVFHRTVVTVILMGAVVGVIPVIMKTREGLAGVPRVLKNVGRSFSIAPRDEFWLIDFPAAVPAIFTGLRLGVIYILVNIIGVEFLIDYGGLGRLISDLYAQYDIAQMYAAIVLVVAISLVFLWCFDRLQRWLRPV